MKTSLIITTYNWPKALAAVLESARHQIQLPLEVLIADDGSSSGTSQLIEECAESFPCPLHHIWQEDDGFRAAAIRNKAAAKAKGEFIIFIDGDTLIRPEFIKNHQRLAMQGYFSAGNRVLLTRDFTQQVLSENLPVAQWQPGAFNAHQINRPWALNTLTLGPLRLLKRNQWKGVKTCNLGVWKEDLVAVNGFDESFVGWGYEDSELAIRLLNKGIKQLDCRFAATVMHLWHKENDRTREKENLEMLNTAIISKKAEAISGIKQYL
ncbi:glycosyltransferase family 2 protein [Endozoicomonas sp. SESOKO1]|uniref:glycosyltransferase family 2 protein n=1 Tax=Endozoicomonas sp. SESOKO1 TaxID=2828742 RepID=UPI0021472C19|nr:glycosyltransferase family 2 protein [Endozoicomonas sp. SESOKO1]